MEEGVGVGGWWGWWGRSQSYNKREECVLKRPIQPQAISLCNFILYRDDIFLAIINFARTWSSHTHCRPSTHLFRSHQSYVTTVNPIYSGSSTDQKLPLKSSHAHTALWVPPKFSPLEHHLSTMWSEHSLNWSLGKMFTSWSQLNTTWISHNNNVDNNILPGRHRIFFISDKISWTQKPNLTCQ